MSTANIISNPKLIDPLTYNQPCKNKHGRFTFKERIINCLKGLIEMIKNLFRSRAEKRDLLKLEMVSTGSSKLENRVKTLWVDDEEGIKNTLKSGDVIHVMGT